MCFDSAWLEAVEELVAKLSSSYSSSLATEISGFPPCRKLRLTTSNYALGILRFATKTDFVFYGAFLYGKSLYLEFLLPDWPLRETMIAPLFVKIKYTK